MRRCHDNVNFATGVNHPSGPQSDDNRCRHIPQGELPFDASIMGRTAACGFQGVLSSF